MKAAGFAPGADERLGRYELLMELGRGGMAELYLAHLKGYGGFERIVALKRILPHLAQDPQFKELFLNEGRIAARLTHRNVCMVFELDEADGELFIAMEYLDGVTWDQLIAKTPPGAAALRLTAAVIAQAVEGLHYAHSLCDIEDRPTPVIHRDVSPGDSGAIADGLKPLAMNQTAMTISCRKSGSERTPSDDSPNMPPSDGTMESTAPTSPQPESHRGTSRDW